LTIEYLKSGAVRPVDNCRLSKRLILSNSDSLCYLLLAYRKLVERGEIQMARVTVEDCLANVDSRFTLVHLAVRRVLQLRHGAPPALENVKGNKEVVLALREIAAGTINPDNIREIEESRPLPEEHELPGADAVRADLQDILDEVGSFGASIEYGSSAGYFEEDQSPEIPQGD
jgi:DNA-directed RNA polymerase subunit omega